MYSRGFERRLVETRKRGARRRRLKVSRGQIVFHAGGVKVRRHIEAVHVLLEHAVENNFERIATVNFELVVELNVQLLAVERDEIAVDGNLPIAFVEHGDLAHVQLVRVQHDEIDVAQRSKCDGHRALVEERGEVGMQEQVVVKRFDELRKSNVGPRKWFTVGGERRRAATATDAAR